MIRSFRPAPAQAAALAGLPATTAMHAATNSPHTGTPDLDIIAGMIPHHPGTIDPARSALKYVIAPEVRSFAAGIIAAQGAELTSMTDRLAKNAT